ncbi:MAG: DUF5683 domain-containing protein [Gemmatimonadaceae bacterium]
MSLHSRLPSAASRSLPSRYLPSRHLRWCCLLALTAAALAAPATLVAQQRDTTTRAPRPAAAPAAPDSARADSARRAPAPGDTVRRRPARTRRGAPVDTLADSLSRPPISPKRAFLYSFVVPGLGQDRLRRRKAEALFATVELGAWFMIGKSQNDLRIARAHKKDSVFVRNDPPVPPSIDSVAVFSPDPLAARIKARRLHVEDWIAVVIFNHLISGADAFVAAHLWDVPAQVSLRPMPRGVAVSASIAW